jgi:hypothetical protein
MDMKTIIPRKILIMKMIIKSKNKKKEEGEKKWKNIKT